MADESQADDQALYDVWDRFDSDTVGAYFERLEALYRAFVRLRGNPPPPDMRAEATDLRDTLLHLAHLPIFAKVLGP